jgi:hypothetical protein
MIPYKQLNLSFERIRGILHLFAGLKMVEDVKRELRPDTDEDPEE